MKRNLFYLKSALGVVALAVTGLSSFAENPSDAFVADFTNAFEKRDSIAQDVKETAFARLKSNPSADSASRALRKFFPALDTALGEKNREAAIKQLVKLTETGDPFLSAEAHYAIGRRFLADKRHEEGSAVFDKVANQLAAHTLRVGEAHYYLAICQAEMLEKDKAVGTLETMLAFFGEDVSNRIRRDAEDRLIQLKKDVEGSLGDVANHMGFSERKLGHADSGERTQEVQEHIVSMLDELIAQAEKSPP